MAQPVFLDLGNGQHIEVPEGMTPEQAEQDYLQSTKGNAFGGPANAAATGVAPRQPSQWSHQGALLAQAAANGIVGTVNAIPEGINLAAAGVNKLVGGTPEGHQDMPTVPYPDFGPNAKPQGVGEALESGAVSGATGAALGGFLSRAPTAISSAGKYLLPEIPRLLKELGLSGVLPGMATAGTEQALDTSKLDPTTKALVETAIGAAAAIAGHAAFGGNVTEGVAGKLGESRNSDEAGAVAKQNVVDWRKGLNAKIEELKNTSEGPVAEPDINAADATHDKLLFGKVPLGSATVQNNSLLEMLNSLSNSGGVYKDFFHTFVNSSTPKMQNLMESVAGTNDPIIHYPPKETKTTPGMNTVHEGEADYFNPPMEGEAIRPQQGPGLHGGWEVPTEAELRNQKARAAAGKEPNFVFRPNDSTPTPTSPLLHPEDAAKMDAIQHALGLGPYEELKFPPREASPVPSEEGGPGGPLGPAPKPKQPRMASGKFQKKGYGVVPYEEPGLPQGGPAPQEQEQAQATSAGAGTANVPSTSTAPPSTAPNALVPHLEFISEGGHTSTSMPQGTIIGFRAPLKDAMELRSAIGEWIQNPRLMPKDIDEAHVSALYKAISADIGNTMEFHGARPEWERYNKATSDLYHAGNVLSKFASDVNPAKDTVKGGEAVKSVFAGMKKDSETISAMREHVPEAADEVAAAFLRSQPQDWHRLPERSKAALVPNPFDRLALDTSAPKVPNALERINEKAASGLSGFIGTAAAESLLAHDHLLGATSQVGALPYVLGAFAAPYAVKGAAHVIKNPAMLKSPLIGGIAGRNAGRAFPSAGTSPLLTPPEGQ